MTDENELQRFKNVVATIALEHPDMNMRDGILLALKVEEELAHSPELLKAKSSPSVKDPLDLAQWVWDNHKTDPDCVKIMGELISHKKINAIKALRMATGAGLRESKDAVEAIEHSLPGRPMKLRPPPPPF